MATIVEYIAHRILGTLWERVEMFGFDTEST